MTLAHFAMTKPEEYKSI